MPTHPAARLAVAAFAAACAPALAAHAGFSPFHRGDAPPPFTLTLTPSHTVINIHDPATHTVTVTAAAAGVGGIGAVSGFTGVSITQDGPPDTGLFHATVLDPFRALAFGDGSSGPAIAGLAGGQAAFPPHIPIDPRLDLFSFSFTDLDLTERSVLITVTGLGGYFTSADGTSTLPFQPFASAELRLHIVPSPAPITLGALAALFTARRRRSRGGAEFHSAPSPRGADILPASPSPVGPTSSRPLPSWSRHHVGFFSTLALTLALCIPTAHAQQAGSATAQGMQAAPARLPLLTGRVVDESGRPLAGATVTLLGEGGSSANADASGRFRLALPGADQDVVLTAQANGGGEGEQTTLYGVLEVPAADVVRPQTIVARGMCELAWSPLGIGVSGGGGVSPVVHALTKFDDGNGPALYAAGSFTSAGGRPAPRIARWDGSSWSRLGSTGVNDTIAALTVFDDGTSTALYAGGDFSRAGDQTADGIAKWDGSSWSPLGSGVSVNGFLPGPVYALTVFDDGTGHALYVGGGFTRAGGQMALSIAKWNGSSWSPLGSGVSGAASSVRALTVFDDGTGPALYAGGWFSSAGGQPASSIAKWDGSSWSPLGSGISGQVIALTVFDDGTGPALYAGGWFTAAGGQPARNIAKWDGSSWSPLGQGVGWFDNSDAMVQTLTAFDDGAGAALYVSGWFGSAGSLLVGNIAKWDGSSWSYVGDNFLDRLVNDIVEATTVFDDGTGPALYAGGWFTNAGGQPANRIARWGCVGGVQPTSIDLSVVSGQLVSSDFIEAGQPVEAVVTVRNHAALPYTGRIQTSLLASVDDHPSPDDISVLTVITPVLTIPPGQTVVVELEGNASITLPNGQRRLLAVARGIGEDEDESNNALPIAEVTLQSLTVGPGGAFFHLAPGESVLIPIELESDVGVLAELVSDLPSGSIDLFAGTGHVSTTSHAVSSLPGAGVSPTLAVPTESSPGLWQLLVRARSTNPQTAACLLDFRPAPLALLSTDRTEVAAVSPVSLDMRTSGVPLGSAFFLAPVDDPGAEIPAVADGIAHSTRATPRFDLADAVPGAYTLGVRMPSAAIAMLPGTIQVLAPSQQAAGGVRMNLSAPELVMVRRDYPISVSWSNAGEADLPAPVIFVRGTNGLEREIVARGRSGNIDVMLPGEAGPGMGAVQRRDTVGSTTYTVSVLDYAGQPFDWNQVVEQHTPDFVTDPHVWRAEIVPLLEQEIGTTWDEVMSFIRVVGGNAGADPGEALSYYISVFSASMMDSEYAFGMPGSFTPHVQNINNHPIGPNTRIVIGAHGMKLTGQSSTPAIQSSNEYRQRLINPLVAAAAGRDVAVFNLAWDSRGINPRAVSSRIAAVAEVLYAELISQGINDPNRITAVGESFGNPLLSELNRLYQQDRLGTIHRHLAFNPANDLGTSDDRFKFRPFAQETITGRSNQTSYDNQTPAPAPNNIEILMHTIGSGCALWNLSCQLREHTSFTNAFGGWLGSDNSDDRAYTLSFFLDPLDAWPIGFGVASPVGGFNYEVADRSYPSLRMIDGGISPPVRPVHDLPSITEMPVASATTTAVTSMDPNDILGPAGYGPERWIAADTELVYTIRFENLDDATAPAQEVLVTQFLDPDLDPSTVEFIAFGLGEAVWELPPGAAAWQQRLDLRASLGVNADISFDTDPQTGRISLLFEALDPLTNALPIDPRLGLVPPNVNPPEGEGWIAYRVRPRPGLPTGTVIGAEARIFFDLNDPIDTPYIFNTIDADPPHTIVGDVPAASARTVRVPWTQDGDDIGSPLRFVYLYASRDGGPFQLVDAGPADQTPELTFTGEAFSEYRLLVVGVDAVGNVEPGGLADLLPRTRVFDAWPDDVLDPQDFFQFLNWYTAGDPRADANGDGQVDFQDFYLVMQGVLQQ